MKEAKKNLDIPNLPRTDKGRIKELVEDIDRLRDSGAKLPAIYAYLKEKKLVNGSESNFRKHYFALKKIQKPLVNKHAPTTEPSSLPNSSNLNVDESTAAITQNSVIGGFDFEQQQRLADLIFRDNRQGDS